MRYRMLLMPAALLAAALVLGGCPREETPTAVEQGVQQEYGPFAGLTADHEQVMALLDRMEQETDPTQSAALLDQFRSAIVPHMQAEEQVLYPVVSELQGDEAREWATTALQGHQTAKQIVAQMGPGLTSEQYLEHIDRLQELLEAHFDLEENNIFGAVRDHVGDQRLEMMENQLQRTKMDAMQRSGGTTQPMMPQQTAPRTY